MKIEPRVHAAIDQLVAGGRDPVSITTREIRDITLTGGLSDISRCKATWLEKRRGLQQSSAPAAALMAPLDPDILLPVLLYLAEVAEKLVPLSDDKEVRFRQNKVFDKLRRLADELGVDDKPILG